MDRGDERPRVKSTTKSESEGALSLATAAGPAIPENKTVANVHNAGSDEAGPAATVSAPSTKAKKAAKSAKAKPAARKEAEPATAAPHEPATAAQDGATNGAAAVAPGTQTPAAAQPLNGHMPVAALRVHEDNEKIYGKKEKDADLEKSLAKSGILDPLLITKDGRVISGHRRFRVATKLGIVEVPVRIFESEDELEIKTALLEHNRHRIKNKAQLAAEAKMIQQIEKELAGRRKKDSAGKAEVEKLPSGKKGKARDAVGKTLGISGRSVDKAVKVAGAIEMLKAAGKEAEANQLEAALEKGFDTGHKAAVEMGALPKAEPKKDKKNVATASAEKITTPPATVDSVSGTSVPKQQSDDEGLASDRAMEQADAVVTYLRSLTDGDLSKSQKNAWERLFDELDECRADLSL